MSDRAIIAILLAPLIVAVVLYVTGTLTMPAIYFVPLLALCIAPGYILARTYAAQRRQATSATTNGGAAESSARILLQAISVVVVIMFCVSYICGLMYLRAAYTPEEVSKIGTDPTYQNKCFTTSPVGKSHITCVGTGYDTILSNIIYPTQRGIPGSFLHRIP